MFAGMRFSLHSLHTRDDASGSSMAQSTMSASSKSAGSKCLSLWETCPSETRKATSSFRPDVGQITVTLASALRAWRMRPAATYARHVVSYCIIDIYISGAEIRMKDDSYTSPPPTTTIFLSLACQAIIREPPPWTGGYLCDMVTGNQSVYH